MKSINRVFSNLKRGFMSEDTQHENDGQSVHSNTQETSGSSSTGSSLRKIFTPKKRRSEMRARRKEMSLRYTNKYNPFDGNSITSLMQETPPNVDMFSPQPSTPKRPQQQQQQQQQQQSPFVQCVGNMENQSFISKAQQVTNSPASFFSPGFPLHSPSPRSHSKSRTHTPGPVAFSPGPKASYANFMKTPTKQLYRSSDIGSGVASASSMYSPLPMSHGNQSFIASPQMSHPSVMRAAGMNRNQALTPNRTLFNRSPMTSRRRITPRTEPIKRTRGTLIREDVSQISSPSVNRLQQSGNVVDKNGSPVLAPRSPNVLQSQSPLAVPRFEIGGNRNSIGKKRVRNMFSKSPATPMHRRLGDNDEEMSDERSSLNVPRSAKRRRTGTTTSVIPSDDHAYSFNIPQQDAVEMVPYTLRVMVVEARDLTEVDIGFKDYTSPYVCLSIDGSEQPKKTSVQPRTTTPKFDQSFVFTVMARHHYETSHHGQQRKLSHATLTTSEGKGKKLVMAVHDHDNILEHQCIGKVRIDLDDLLQECLEAQKERGESQVIRNNWFKLRGVKKGELRLVYQMGKGVNFSI